jgi:hypothetical protein
MMKKIRFEKGMIQERRDKTLDVERKVEKMRAFKSTGVFFFTPFSINDVDPSLWVLFHRFHGRYRGFQIRFIGSHLLSFPKNTD